MLLLGIKIESCEAGCSSSKPVRASLEEAIAEVLNELDRLKVRYRWRTSPIELDIWWANGEKLAALPA